MRTMYNYTKFEQHYKAEMKYLYKELLVARKKVQETVLLSVLQNEGRCWTELNK